MNKNIRNVKLDYIKAFGIALVVMGHAIQLFNGEDYRIGQYFYENIIYKMIYSFHMPLFMFISGYVYYYEKTQFKHNIKNNVKKIIRYLIIIFSFATIKTICYYFTHTALIGLESLIRYMIHNIFHVLWFLWALIYSRIIIGIVRHIYLNRRYQKKLVVGCVSLGLFLIFLLSPDILMGNVYKYVIPYFGMGYLMNKYRIMLKSPGKYIILVVLFAFWFAMAINYNKNTYIYTSGISIFFSSRGFIEQLFIDIYRWLSGFIGTLLVWLLFDNVRIEGRDLECGILRVLHKVLGYIGKNTIIIYSFSTEIFNEIFYEFTKSYQFSYTRAFLLSILMIVVCVLVAWLLNLDCMRIPSITQLN